MNKKLKIGLFGISLSLLCIYYFYVCQENEEEINDEEIFDDEIINEDNNSFRNFLKSTNI